MRTVACKTALLLLLISAVIRTGYGQFKCAFAHYSVEDGLSEGVVLTMHQDREGLMWFGTFDGLNRFDGYGFKVYKSGFNSAFGLTNNRVDRITEDDLGYLWIMNNDGEVYRMNSRTEEFINFNEISSSGSANYSPVNHIYCFSGGETWLQTEAGSCIRVISSATSSEYTLDRFDCSNGNEPDTHVNLVSRDSRGMVWILTGNGLFQVRGKELMTVRMNGGNNPPAGNNTFFCLYEAGEKIWFGSGNGTIIVTDTAAVTHEEIRLGISSDIISIKPLNQRELILLTSGDGFFVYTPVTGDRKQYNTSRFPVLPSDRMESVYVDRYGEAWIESAADGVTHFDPFAGAVKHFRMNVDKTNPNVLLPSFVIFEDVNDILWVYPRGGGFSRYNRMTGRLEYFFNEPGSTDRRFPNLIHSALSDRQGNLWMCTITRGIEKVSFFPSLFRVMSPKPVAASHSENEVRALFEDKNRYLWAATRDGRVYLFDPARNMIGHLRNNGTFSSGSDFNALVYVITQDSRGNIWMGSKGRGLFRLEPTTTGSGSGSGCCYRITGYRHDDADPFSLSHDNVYSVHEDPEGRIWVGTFNGGLNYITEENNQVKFINSNNRLTGYPYSNHKRVRYITSDKQGRIWVGTTSGLVIFNRNFTRPEGALFTTCFFDPGVETSLANNDVHYIYCSPDDETFVATFGGGLNRVIRYGKRPEFKSYTIRTGAPDDVILSIVDDLNGNLWLSSERGILKFNRQTESFEIYSEQSGVEKRYFSEATGILTGDNEIMFGFDNGIYCFSPSQVRKVNYVPPLLFTRLTVAGNDVRMAGSSAASSLNEQSDTYMELRHDQKSLTIEYAALDYRNPKNIQYAHMLEGVDPDWIIARGQRSASYTNLDPGEYLFSVRSTNSDGIWVDNNRTIRVTVRPSFWQTLLAKMMIVIFSLGLIALAIYVILTMYKLRHKVEIEQIITNLKLKFFTDISHELRTPLTLISSPVTNILQNNSLEPEVRDQLTLVQSNTQRMLRLVNQILDFRKVQNRKMKLRIEEFPLGPFISGICADFRKVADDKGIRFILEDHSDGEKVWADRDKVEKIAFNLITNALKFTPRGKIVRVTVRKNSDTLELIVADQGTGLSREKMKNLFARFSSDDKEPMPLQPGTGIGLSLSRELAELHRAELTAESEEGKGATFRVTFRLGFSHFDNETEFVIADGQNPLKSQQSSSAMQEEDEEFENEGEEDNEPVLLFIEDNEELRSFLKIILSDGFHVIEAGNGTEGFEIARSQLPDIIITDLMMPGMDGLELARRIKEEVTTSHIPVVVLTAKTDLDTQVEALKTGADDFITKPFSSTYLKARIENILEQRKKLQELFLSSLDNYPRIKSGKAVEITPSEPVIVSYDDRLMKSLMEVMEENIDNSGLTVDELVSKMGIGRSVFFKKLKSLTGLAPVEFIREVRVKRAAQLIESGEYTISQVTYMVGCNDPRYFSRIFKQRFGMTPSEYRDRNAKQKQT
jgi:signal transduction histidine kinase/DNA-binding response OmpR family regulator/ligand-binding sensor domain-containing protein